MIETVASTKSATRKVAFEVPPDVNAQTANLCGDFNDWDTTTYPMKRHKDGRFTLTISLESGRSYRYRYLLDGERWENDAAADEYVPNPFGSYELGSPTLDLALYPDLRAGSRRIAT